MSYLASSNLSGGLDSYEPAPEYTAAVSSHTEAPDWVLSTYYIGTLIFSMVAIVTAAGQVYTRLNCDSFKSPGSKTGADIFEVFAWVTIVISFIILVMSIYALVSRMGFSAQIKKAWGKLKSRRPVTDVVSAYPLSRGQSDLAATLHDSNPPLYSNLASNLDSHLDSHLEASGSYQPSNYSNYSNLDAQYSTLEAPSTYV
jgi:hypothetical protein